MAAISKSSSKTFGRTAGRRNGAGDFARKASPDYLVLVLVLALMGAILALSMWLASYGGATVDPGDYWMLMP